MNDNKCPLALQNAYKICPQGLYVGSIIFARFGRRKSMFCMSIWALMSATVLVTSTKIEQVLAGRILRDAYIGMELSTCPPYQAEIIPAPVRGFAVGTYQASLLLGGIVINSICRGTSELPTNAAWRIPQGLFYIVPFIVATCVWFIPESPRWLLIKDRPEEARESPRQLRENLPDYEIDKELETLRGSLAEEHNQGGYRDLFRGQNLKKNRHYHWHEFLHPIYGLSVYGGVRDAVCAARWGHQPVQLRHHELLHQCIFMLGCHPHHRQDYPKITLVHWVHLASQLTPDDGRCRNSASSFFGT